MKSTYPPTSSDGLAALSKSDPAGVANLAGQGLRQSFITCDIANGANTIHRKISSTYATNATAISIGAKSADGWR